MLPRQINTVAVPELWVVPAVRHAQDRKILGEIESYNSGDGAGELPVVSDWNHLSTTGIGSCASTDVVVVAPPGGHIKDRVQIWEEYLKDRLSRSWL